MKDRLCRLLAVARARRDRVAIINLTNRLARLEGIPESELRLLWGDR